jgi:hypothetical protein
MMKNSEWGAVAFLTQSKYGRNGHEININNSATYVTGNGGGGVSVSYSSGITYSYNSVKGAKASTTGNIYGIYDMSGGAKEYVATYDKKGSSTYLAGSSYGVNMTKNAKSGENYISTKYITAYSNGTSEYSSASTLYTVSITGDATKEVMQKSTSHGWFSDTSCFVCSNRPFFTRGGSYVDGSYAGLFNSYSYFGGGYTDESFRVVLCP